MCRTHLFVGVCLGVLSLSFGCQGDIGEVSDNPSVVPGEPPPPTPMVDELGNPVLPELEPIPARLWVLTPTQMENTIRRTMPYVEWTTSLRSMSGFNGRADLFVMGTRNVETLAAVAREVGASAAADPSMLSGCLPDGFADDECRAHVLASVARGLFRRPLSAEEADLFADFWSAERTMPSATETDALGSVIASMILSPAFLYRDELNEGMMDDYGIASAMSYFITDAPPDAELRAAADAGELSSPSGREEHARRLLGAAELAPGVRRFFADLFRYENVLSVVNEDYPEFTPEVREAMAEESRRFVDHVLWADDARLETLLTAPYTFVNGPLAEFYGLDESPEGFEQVASGPRVGLLGQGSFSARFGSGTFTKPVQRGTFVRAELLCAELSAVPDNAAGIPWEDGDTERDNLDAHSRGTCLGCHRYMDDPGLAFENFDAVGRWREDISVYETASDSMVPSDLPVDASGELVRQFSEGESIAFEDFQGMVEGMSDFSETHFCVVKRAFQWVYGTDELAGDRDRFEAVASHFSDTDGDLLELFVSLISADEFFYRGEAQ